MDFVYNQVKCTLVHGYVFYAKKKQKPNKKERNSMKLNNKNSFINLSIL